MSRSKGFPAYICLIYSQYLQSVAGGSEMGDDVKWTYMSFHRTENMWGL